MASNDDACGDLGSQLDYTAERGGTYTLVLGCYAGGSCGGTVAYEITDAPPAPPTPPPPLAPPVLRVVSAARALVAVDNEGGALLADAFAEVRFLDLFVLRAGGTPLGLGGGVNGGIAAGTVHGVIGFDLQIVEVGMGGGLAVLASRLEGVDGREIGVLVTRGRIGRLHMFHVEAQFAIAFSRLETSANLFSADITARLPLGDFDLALRASAGHDGTAMGEAIVTTWLVREEGRNVFGLTLHGGGGGLFYQPVCRFGAPCTNRRWYAGPMLGVGMEWRP